MSAQAAHADEPSHIVASAGGRIALAFALLAAIALTPLFVTRLPPLVDYPNHLARMHILAAHGVTPALTSFYAVDWAPLPNLAMDAVVPLLARLMPLEWAGKLFLGVTLLLLVVGTIAVHRALWQRWSAWPLLAFLLLYNRVLIWGFLNFLFGTGLGLLAFAAWLGLRQRGWALRIAVGSVLALLLYFAHLFALGGYALLVLSYEIGRIGQEATSARRRLARAAVVAIPFILPALLFLSSPIGAGGVVEYGRFIRKFDLFFTVFNAYDLMLDGATFGLLLLGLIVGLWRGTVVIARDMRLPLVALLVVHFVLPSTIFTASGVDHRLPVLFAFVLVAATRPAVRRPSAGTVIGIALAGLFAARMTSVTIEWHRSDLVYRDMIAALETLPAASRLAVAHPAELVNVFRRVPPLVHLPTLAVVLRDAFVPTVFANPAQQPVTFAPAYRELAATAAPAVLWSALVASSTQHRPSPGMDALLCRFDAVVVVAPEPFQIADIPALRLAWSGPYMRLLRVSRDTKGCAS